MKKHQNEHHEEYIPFDQQKIINVETEANLQTAVPAEFTLLEAL